MGTATGDSIPTRPSLLNRLKSGEDPESWREFYAIYGPLYVLKEQPAREVARTAGISVARVYLAKHRVGAALSREARRLESQIKG